MRPDDPRTNGSVIPQRPLLGTAPERRPDRTAQAAAAVARTQIDSIYERTPQQTSEPQPANPYARNHTTREHIQASQWAKYHSAWQEYYQKYYERYYIGQVYKTRQALEAQARQNPADSSAAPSAAVHENQPTSFSRDEALYELRSSIRDKVRASAMKIRKSRHFMPITAALLVMMVFLFLQYNRILFANVEAYVSPGNIDPANIIVDPTVTVAVGKEPKIIIPNINVEAPVDFNALPDYASQMKSMEKGVAWFGIPGANSKPGQVGNTPISGHSSNDWLDKGDYKFIFARLDFLTNGDTIYINYEGIRYTYTVTKKEIVSPTEISKLIYPTNKPVITLITCTPVGTSLNRLLVTAEQVSPDPNTAAKAPIPTGAPNQPVTIPGSSPTFLQRIFGGGN